MNKYRVVKAGIGIDTISAVSFTTTYGVLTFFTCKPGPGQKRELVKAYGVGMWITVEPVSDD